MKKLKYILSSFILFGLLLSIGCADDDTDLSLEDRQFLALLGQWTTSSTSDVQLGGGDAPGDWSNFSITFSEPANVSIANAPTDIDIFNISTFGLSGDNTSLLSLTFNGDANETATAEIDGNSMTLTFTLASDSDKLGARENSVNGTWTFFLTKQ